MWPLFILTDFRKIAESIPFELFCGYGAAQFDLAVADSDHLPISFPGPAIDVNFLTHLKGIGLKK
jgi:hypothetical protein